MLFNSCLTTQAYSLAYFLPIILNETLNFDIGMSQLLSAPPYGCAGILMYGLAWLGDRYRYRGPVIVFLACLGIIGTPILVQSVLLYCFALLLICCSVGLKLLAFVTSVSSSSAAQPMAAFLQLWPTKQTIFGVNGSELLHLPRSSGLAELAELQAQPSSVLRMLP